MEEKQKVTSETDPVKVTGVICDLCGESTLVLCSGLNRMESVRWFATPLAKKHLSIIRRGSAQMSIELLPK